MVTYPVKGTPLTLFSHICSRVKDFSTEKCAESWLPRYLFMVGRPVHLHAFIHLFKPMGNVVTCFQEVGRNQRTRRKTQKLHTDSSTLPMQSHGWIFQNITIEAHVHQQTHKQSPSVHNHATLHLSSVLLHLLQLLISVFGFILYLPLHFHCICFSSADFPLFFKAESIMMSVIVHGNFPIQN